MTFYIEESPNNRATCRYCRQKIKKGEIRVFGALGSGIYGYYYHLYCFLSRCPDFLYSIFRYVLPTYFRDDEEAISLIKRLYETYNLKEISKKIGRYDYEY
jgi:transposase InsO family protein